MQTKTIAAVIAAACGTANAQVVINEIYQNPPGSGSANDAFLEYIELYGPPGMDLTGYAVALLNGGEDPDGDDIPNSIPELDEGFSLDGLSIGANGFLVLYNGLPSQSDIPPELPGDGETSASFFDTHLPSPFDTNGNLQNDGSSTFLLVRRRPFHSVVDGLSVYAPGYSFWKDVQHDVDFDGRTDFGIEGPGAVMFEPIQIIDELAFSNAGGKEYVLSSEQEISETVNFNPDAVSRLAYYGENPMLGVRLNSELETVPTRTADEEFIYGDMIGSSLDFTYDASRSGAPTDPNGDGFQDISIESGGDSFKLTPGTFNDHGATGINQFRFVAGDLNFDGSTDAQDLALLDASLLGGDLDATEDYIDPDTQAPIADPNNPGTNFQRYVYQGRLANAFLAARDLDPADGIDGANAETVTASDRGVLAGLVGPVPCSPADLAAPFDTLNFFDLGEFLNQFNAQSPGADLAAPFGVWNFFDLGEFLNIFNQGCPI